MAKRPKKKSPTARTLERIREQGGLAEVVEKTLPKCFIKKDLFGCIDIIALRNGRIVGIQATSDGNHATRLKKSMEEGRLVTWLTSGGLFEVWSWSKFLPVGAKREKWTARVDQIRISEGTVLPAIPQPKPPLLLFKPKAKINLFALPPIPNK